MAPTVFANVKGCSLLAGIITYSIDVLFKLKADIPIIYNNTISLISLPYLEVYYEECNHYWTDIDIDSHRLYGLP